MRPRERDVLALDHKEPDRIPIDLGGFQTGIHRRAKLWTETLDAIQSSMRGDHELVFITKYGNSWAGTHNNHPVAREFKKLLERASLYRKGLGFYALRHTFETGAGDTGDQVAVSHIMGHADNSMSALYRERIDDARLERISDHVHAWLFRSGGRAR